MTGNESLHERIVRLRRSLSNICAMSKMGIAFPDGLIDDYGLVATPTVVYINRDMEHARVAWSELRSHEVAILESVDVWRPAHPTKHPLELLADAAE